MSRTLTLIHAGWTAARDTARSGRGADALTQVTRLLARPDLPAVVAADAHRLAAEILIEGERYAAARRHLRAARELQPLHARGFYLAGLAAERDPDGSDRRAAVRFRTASELEPGNALFRAAFGRAAVRCDRAATGVRELTAAAEAGLEDTAVLRVAVDGLLEAGRVGAARTVLIKARFARPRNADVLRLWDRVRFEAVRRGQRKTRSPQDARVATEGAFPFLPFVRIAGGTSPRHPAKGPATRRDLLSIPRPHFARFGATKADR